MTEPTVPADTDPNSVRKVMNVQAHTVLAWRVFTEKMGTWWPLAVYKIGKTKAVDASSSRGSAGAGTSAATMGARASGAACSRGSRPLAWCFPGILTPTGNTTLI